MDIRKAEEFKIKHKEMVEKRALEEISAVNIIRSMISTEELRIKAYEKAQIGHHGPAVTITGVGLAFYFYSYTKGFKASFPKASTFFSKSISIRLFMLLVVVRSSLYIEQVYFESNLNPIAFDEYMEAYKYTEDLKMRRVEKLDFLDRIKFGLGYDLKYYLNSIKSIFK